MEIIIRNIGVIKDASVRLDGLTIIAGENDTGKSTVGKVLFSIVKGVNNHDKEFKEEKFFKVEDIIENIYFDMRRYVKFHPHSSLDEDLRVLEYAHPMKFKRRFSSLVSLEDNEGIVRFIGNYKRNIQNEIDNLEFPIADKNKLYAYFDLLDSIVSDLMTPDKYVFESITSALDSEFSGEISNKENRNDGLIIYEENDETILYCEIKNDRPGFAVTSQTPMEIQDATIIESPQVFQMYKMISQTNIFFNSVSSKKRKNNFYVPFHLKDLITKISDSSYYVKNEEFIRDSIIEKLNHVVSGESFFDSEDEDFYFKRAINNQYYSFATSNVASGIKSFGILQMLLKSQALNDRSVLILDEPEIHLHPEWQIKYCEAITMLVEMGVKIVVNTHSPYILQALKVLSEKKSLTSKTNYYLAEEDENPSFRKITNVNSDLNRVFKKLSDPIQRLVWE